MTAPKVDPAKHVYDAVVMRVKDGDTIAVSFRLRRTRMAERDLGFHLYVEGGFISLHEDVRFLGIDASPQGTPEGARAAAFLGELLAPGSSVRIATKVVRNRDTKEKYGRWLGTVWRPGDDTSINDQMVAAGHARPWDGKGPRP